MKGEWNMSISVLEKSANGVTLVPIEAKAYDERTIWVDGDVNGESCSSFVKQIIELNRKDKYAPIKVMISSPGGAVIYGLAMYDAIVSSLAPVETYCVGTAYSMGAVLFAAGKKRYMLEHSKVMLHEPLISEGAGGSASSVRSMSDSLQKTKKEINNILCKHTGRTMKEMEKATSYDHYFTAEEAIKFGLADEVVGVEQMM